MHSGVEDFFIFREEVLRGMTLAPGRQDQEFGSEQSANDPAQATEEPSPFALPVARKIEMDTAPNTQEQSNETRGQNGERPSAIGLVNPFHGTI